MVRQHYREETFWTFPGGSIEAGETPMEAAIREVKEETGITILIKHEILRTFSSRIRGMYYCYWAENIQGDMKLGEDPELSDLSWIPIKDLVSHHEVKRILPWIESRVHEAR